MNAVHAQPRKLAIFNAKGGTSKTTTAHSLACGLAAQGKRVLAIDLDHQANLSYWFGHDAEGPTLFDAIRGDATLPSTVHPADVAGVDLIPANEYLIGAEPALRAKIGAEVWLRKQIERLPGRWDVIVFDCAPGLGILTIGALVASERVLAPVEPHVLGLAGIRRLLESIEEVRDGLNPGLELLGVLPVKVDRRTALAGEVIEELRRALGDKIMNTIIRTNIRLAEAPSHQKPIYKYAPSSAGAEDYRALTEEVLERWPNA